MNIYETITKRRTVRKFTQDKVQREELIRIIDCARLSATAANLQPLKFAIIDGDTAKKVYPFTKWAGYLKDWEPSQSERPTAYIAVLTDTSIKSADKSEVDCGSAIADMMFEAVELGLGSCWLGAIDREGIKSLLGLDDKYYVSYLLAVGYSAQTGYVFDVKDDNVHYYFDESGNVHVPKRTLDEVLVEI